MLDTNKGLKPGQWLKSSNGKYSLHMQNDGNLVLYSQRGAIWGSGTNARSIAAVYMQADGNLVMYDTNNRPTWASNSGGGTSPKLFVQDDGNVVIYSGSKALWATGTSGRW
ncbi:lectin [Candidatus Saccharibacteria bacterium]|nr:lectin [Candidatus Saccharibacteria bacterium]